MKNARQSARFVAAACILTIASIGTASFAAEKAPPAQGQPWGSRVEIGVLGGWLALDDKVGLGNAFHPENVPVSSPLAGLRVGYTLTPAWAAEAELNWSPSEFKRTDRGSTTLIGYRGVARFSLMPDKALSPFFTLGIGQWGLYSKTEPLNVNAATMTPVDDAGCKDLGAGCQTFQVLKGGDPDDGVKDGDRDLFWQIGAGASYDITWRLSARLDLRWVPSDPRPAAEGEQGQALSNNFEAVVGLTWGFGGPEKDSDGDGLSDDVDKCPTQAEDKDGFEDADGCPELDNDGDGIPDASDKCPNEAEDKDGFEDADGCPELDNDKDGIPDASDKCPTQAEDKDGYQDTDGCPELDNDKDGIPDVKDKCPNQAEDKDGFEDTDGCPELDNDKDGFPDAQDKCPNEPETRNSFKDKDGCPDSMPKHIAPLFTGPAKGVEFKRNKLAKTALPTLEKLLELMLEQDDVKIEVHVHADGRGAPEKWQKVSEERGAIVQAFFSEAGIDPSRFIIKAHGNTQPFGGATGRKAYKANNRVEFKVHDPSRK